MKPKELTEAMHTQYDVKVKKCRCPRLDCWKIKLSKDALDTQQPKTELEILKEALNHSLNPVAQRAKDKENSVFLKKVPLKLGRPGINQ